MNEQTVPWTLPILARAFERLPAVLAALAILIGFWIFYRLTQFSIRRMLERAGVHRTLVSMLVDRIYRVAVTVFALVMAADQIGINVGAALAGIGVVGLAIGFAAQDSIANIIAGFMIFIDKPFEVGDWVTVADRYGAVSDITMRSTRSAGQWRGTDCLAPKGNRLRKCRSQCSASTQRAWKARH
jgi:small conductance mechanosensitive channel